MATSSTLKYNATPCIHSNSKHLNPTFPQHQIFEDLRVTNMSLHSIILECSLNKKRIVNSDENSQKIKYVPIKENVIAQIHSKDRCKDLRNLAGNIKGIRKVELIYFSINENKEVTNITIDKTHYVLLKAKEFLVTSEQVMSRELYFLDKYANQPGILSIVAKYSYTSKSSRRNIDSAPKKAIITRRLQNLATLLEDIKNQDKLSSSIRQLDFFKKEAKKQLLEAILAIHAHGDIHRDIKPQNILWEKVDDSLKFYIIDFDMSVDYSELNNIKKTSGTPRYCDPQILAASHEQRACINEVQRQEIRNKAISQKNDIFSLGLIFYLLRESTHQLPDSIQILMNEQRMFPNNRINLENISLIRFFRSATQDEHLFEKKSFEHLVWRMLRPNPEERITAQEAFEELSKINNETK